MNIDVFFHRNSYWPRLTPILCVLCVASWVGLNLGGANMTYEQSRIYGLLAPTSVWTGQSWSLIASTFAHIQPMHILFNVLWLWTLGNAFENEFGSLRWAAFFVAAAWVSSALQLLSMGDVGIGMSGVIYALFGFGWIARRRYPSFAAIMTQQNLIIALVWMVGCIVVTAVGAAQIGNGAHVGGLLFGLAVAGVCFVPDKAKRFGALAGALFLAGLSFVPLAWCPTSSDWTGLRAMRADKAGDSPTALYWYERTVALDPNATWALHNLALLYGRTGDRTGFARALKQLRAKDADGAKSLEGAFGAR